MYSYEMPYRPFNYRVVPYAPYWSFHVIGAELKELHKNDRNGPVFDREAIAGRKYEIAESIECKAIEIFREIWASKEQKELTVTVFNDRGYDDALKKLLLNTATIAQRCHIQIDEVEKNTFKITWKNLPNCFEDTIAQFDKYRTLFQECSKYS